MHTFLTPTPIAQSEKMSEQMQTQVKAQSSNPAVVKSKAFKFLESIALNNSVKVKATIKEKYMQLESFE